MVFEVTIKIEANSLFFDIIWFNAVSWFQVIDSELILVKSTTFKYNIYVAMVKRKSCKIVWKF